MFLTTTAKGIHMTDQSVRISNLPDSGSAARVAYDLWYSMRAHVPTGTPAQHVKGLLDLYAECLKAANGYNHDTSKLLLK